MIAAVESYLAVRRATGSSLGDTEYSCAALQASRPIKSRHISARQQPLTEPVKRDRSPNDTRITRPSATLLSIFGWNTPGTNCRWTRRYVT